MPVLQTGLAKSAAEAYTIDQSLRFEDGDNAYLERSPTSNGNKKTFTLSLWTKRANLQSSGYMTLLVCGDTSSNDGLFWKDDTIYLYFATKTLETTQVFRDPNAWYHLLVSVDTTQSTETNRVKLYVNGEQVTDFSTTQYPVRDDDTMFNDTSNAFRIGYHRSGAYPLDGYLAEAYLIDGTALDASSFGETDAATNQWKPIEYTGSYGTNGFYQKYSTPYGIEAFTTAGSHTWTCPAGVTSVELLVVAGGGGGGGAHYAGGGGAGGVVHDTSYTVVPGVVYDLSVGAGGAGGGSGANGTEGADSVWNVNAEGSGITFTADGGGKGSMTADTAYSGGSGGGGRYSTAAGGTATQTSPTGATGYGNVGGASGESGTYSGGGGGGAGAVGGSSQSSGVTGKGGAGGAGREFTTFSSYGVSGFFAGGGGGGAYPDSSASVGGAGGSGGGGSGGKSEGGSVAATAGTANTGGGGGGGSYSGSNAAGKAGGSGVVLISVDAGLGADSSGNGNNFSATNLVATDQVLDSPTNNFCTLNPLNPVTGTFSEGNLKYAGPGGWNQCVKSTMEIPNTGKWGFRVDYSGNASGSAEGSVFTLVGVCKTSQTAFTGGPNFAEGLWYSDSGYVYNFSSTAQTETAISNGDYVEMLIDSDANSYIFKLNGTSVNNGTIGTTDPISVVIQQYNNSYANPEFDFGQRGYEPSDSDYKTLCTDNLLDPSIADPTKHFNTVLYAGDDATSRSITGAGFQPDFSWIKNRTSSCDHVLFDVVRGVADTAAGKQLSSNLTSDEPSNTNGHIKSFDSDGFSLRDGSSGSEPRLNTNKGSTNYISWNWKAGGTASSNTDGSITSSVSANTDAGFSIVSYTGTGSAATIGHGLSQAPDLVWTKSRSNDTGDGFTTYSSALPSAGRWLDLSSTAAMPSANSAVWNDTAPTASVFSVGTASGTNTDSYTYVAYCFHSVDGYSKVGSYEGNNNADGNFIYLGFRPAYVVIKDIDNAYDWHVFDDARDPYNAMYHYLRPSNAGVEGTTPIFGDFVSNGFKLRTATSGWNDSSTHIYLAFAESPFKTSNAR